MIFLSFNMGIFTNLAETPARYAKHRFSCSPSGAHVGPLRATSFLVFGCAGSSLLCTSFSPVEASGAALRSPGTGFLLCWLLLLQSAGSRHVGPVGVAPGLQSTGPVVWPSGLVAQQCVGPSRTGDRTPVSCTGRRILYRQTPREAPHTTGF